MFFSSALQRAIKRGLKPGGNLADELRELDDYQIRSKADAQAICNALASLPLKRPADENSFTSSLHALTSLFQDLESPRAPAFKVLYLEGLPLLTRIFDARIQEANEDDEDDLLYVLKILAMYGSQDGAEKIVEAAQMPLKDDAYMWHVILSILGDDHPHRDFVYQALSEHLPSNFLAIAFLDSANKSAIVGTLERHPFDSAEGEQRLRSWLEESDPEKFSYANSATAALPFLTGPGRDQLLHLAMDHPDVGVQIEASWAAAKVGRDAGLRQLARYCLDIAHSSIAQHYLTELGHQELIPKEANEPEFQAKAEFSNWLAHPNELGRAPDELEVVDHRMLAWPPENKPRPFWVLKYRAYDQTGLEEDDVDCGLVGSMTWCFFMYKMDQRPPEDVYAIHCYWEMQNEELIQETEITDPQEYVQLLNQWSGKPLESPTITDVAEVSPKLKTPGRFVALATARLDGEEGWVVLDGPRSAWYPKSEQPNNFNPILNLHIGRQLLGFEESVDRKKFLRSDSPQRSPAEFVAAYEKLINEAANGPVYRQKELLCEHLLSNQFDAYVDAVCETRGLPKSMVVVETYERFLELAAQADESIREACYDSFTVLGRNFEKYVDALVAEERKSDIVKWVEWFTPYWQHNLGHGQLGMAAFKAGAYEPAERHFLSLYEGMDEYYRGESMSMLAEIWFHQGKIDKAQSLLIDCQTKLMQEIKESKYNSDRAMHAEQFQHHQTTFLRLFPGGKDLLVKQGIPENPL